MTLSNTFSRFSIPYLVITFLVVQILHLTVYLMNARTTLLFLAIDPGTDVVAARYLIQLSAKYRNEMSDAYTINGTGKKNIGFLFSV